MVQKADMQKFDLSFHKPRDVKFAISGGELCSHQAAFNSLTLMGQMKQVMQIYDRGSPYLAHYSQLIDVLHKCTYSSLPVFIQLNEPK